MKVIVIGSYSETDRDSLRSLASPAEVSFAEKIDAVRDALDDVDGVVGSFPGELLKKAPHLRWVHSPAAGVNEELTPQMLESDVVLTSSAGNGGVPLAEHAMMLMLMLNRDAPRWARAQAEHRWDHWSHPELNGLTCGIIGLGHSGQDLALKCQAFHMRVLGIRRTLRPTPQVDALFPHERLHDFLAEADFVVVTAPRTPETVGMLGAAEFRAMKRSAHYICFSRGGIADDGALLTALREGWIAGAGLDAHGEEPLPPDSPFWDLPNAIVTPHNGASTPMTRQRGVDIFVENLRRYQAGETLLNVIDKQAGY